MTVPDALRIAFLTYRGNPHSGGQGVYARHLTRALADLGHHVEVISGQPYPELDERVPLHRLRSLDFYNAEHPMQIPPMSEIKSRGDLVELLQFFTLAFPEPLAFSIRAADLLCARAGEFDIVHDNQCLGWGLRMIERAGTPVIATIHHPITVDLRLELERSDTLKRRLLWRRWYAFTKMQKKVARGLSRVLTDSVSSHGDIVADLGVDDSRLHVVPVGVDPSIFRPATPAGKVPGRIFTAASADSAMKGLEFLLEAVAALRETRTVELTVVGKLKPGGQTERRIAELGLTGRVEFVSGIEEERLVALYNQAEVAVVPSLYEGFSLPAIEAQACETALVATTGGALPEVVGTDGETVLLVPPGDAGALRVAIERLLDDAALREKLGRNGRRWVEDRWTWRHTAERTADHYRAAIAARGAAEAAR